MFGTRILWPLFALMYFLPGPRADDVVWLDAQNRVRVTPPPMDPAFRNDAWPTDWEEGFLDRAHQTLTYRAGQGLGGGTSFEQEKVSYPNAMMQWLQGTATGNATRAANAKAFLEGNDVDPWNLVSDRIDLYAAFTLKGQVPKFFFFGEYAGWLNPAHATRMENAVLSWWATDPVGRPHPNYPNPSNDGGWTPPSRGWSIDQRNTDNLKTMREVAVYLFSEHVGNEALRLTYKNHLRNHLLACYRTGISEWDSENYLDWSLSPLLSLYDYAQDSEVKLYAKAMLDLVVTAGALKYSRGGFGGPTKRDYGGGNKVFGAGAASMWHLYFGDCPFPDPNPSPNELHAILSTYRPPLATMAIARKDFARVELLNTKPSYANWNGDPSTPESWETFYTGGTFYLGTSVSRSPIGDVGPFKMLVDHPTRGVGFLVAWSGSTANTMRAGDQIGQYRNLCVFLRPADGSTFSFQAPSDASFETHGGVWFLRFVGGATWAAIRPIGLTYNGTAAAGSAYPDEIRHLGAGSGGGYLGFAMEVGETNDFANFTAFRDAVLAQGALDLTGLADGEVWLTAADGSTRFGMRHNPSDGRPIVYRDRDTPHDWDARFDQYFSPDTAPSVSLAAPASNAVLVAGTPFTLRADAADPVAGPIALGWKEGRLRLDAGGHWFECEVGHTGAVSFASGPSDGTGHVASVDFYLGDTWIGAATSFPYEVSWTVPPPGDYVLRAEAADADGQTSASTLVPFASVADAHENLAPLLTIRRPSVSPAFVPPGVGLLLEASVTDDGLVAPLPSITWQVEAEPLPGAATLADADGPEARAIFDVPGWYRFAVVADDGALRATGRVDCLVGVFPDAAGTFPELADPLVIEAEAYATRATGTGNLSAHTWGLATDWPGFGGSGYMRANPNTGHNAGTGDHGPRLDFPVRFGAAGTVYLWLRGYAPGAADDSLHAGMDGILASSSGSGNFGMTLDLKNAWTWTGSAAGQPVRLEIPAPGIHTVSVWMREDGAAVDRLLLTRDPVFVPTGTGPVAAVRVDNVAPWVDAGPDDTVLPGTTNALAGIVSDDGLPASPGVATSLWTVVWGTGTATFSDPADPFSPLTLTAPGAWRLRLRADDGRVATFDEMERVASDSFEAWSQRHLDAAEQAAPDLANTHHDPDPLTLLLEYAHGRDLREADVEDTVIFEPGPDGLRVTYERNRAATDVEIRIETNGNLQADAWGPVGTPPELLWRGPLLERLRVHAPLPGTNQTQNVRLRAIHAP